MQRHRTLCLTVLGAAFLLCGSVLPAHAQRATLEILVGDRERTALIDPGRAATTTSSPLVLVFHPLGSNKAAEMARLTRFKEAWPEATIVYPNAINGGWASLPGFDDPDLAFIDALIERVKGDYRVDPRRIYAVGYSNGGFLALNLLVERPESFAAIAAVAAGALPTLQWATTPRPFMMVVGKQDFVHEAERIRNQALRLNDCGGETIEWAPGTPLYTPCGSGQPVLLWTHPGGHEWPMGTTAQVVRFFRERALPAGAAPRGPAGDLVSYPSVVGLGKPGVPVSGGVATETPVAFPTAATMDGAGRLYFADDMGWRVHQIGADERLTVVKGLSFPTIGFIEAMVADRAGNLYVADTNKRVVFRRSPNGAMRVVAGRERSMGRPLGYGGDEGSATQAELAVPLGLAVDRAGNLYIADSDNHRIRRVDPGGAIRTIAGNGTPGFSGDGGPAVAARLYAPAGLAIGPDGSLYIADAGNHRVRKMSPEGTISTVAGNGMRGLSGDGGLAITARLNAPVSVAVDQQGNLFVADSHNFRVRKVAMDSLITTIFVNEPGETAPAPDRARFYPESLTIDRAGNLLVTDPFNHRIWKVTGVAAPGLVAGEPFPAQ